MTRPLKIIVVEDDALIAMDLEELLTAMGHDVCACAYTEAEAVLAAGRHHPELMLVDGSLAQGSGVSAMAQILAHGFVAHLYMTGDPGRILQQVPGAVVLAKPFNQKAMADGIERAMRNAGSSDTAGNSDTGPDRPIA